MKKKRLLVVFIIVLLGVSSLYLIQNSYAKYRKKVIQQVEVSLANWDIKLNNESIAGKNTISGNITPIFESNEYIAEGVLAPGSTGYFDIEIDAINVDVSFSYLLNVSANEEYPDIVAYGYTMDPENNTEVIDFTEEGISGEIVHNTSSTKLRIYIKWDDSSENFMDNAADTALAISNSTLAINATFHFSQINN